MRIVFFCLLLASCASQSPYTHPSWVEAVRNGEGGLKVVQGQKIFYRRISDAGAGSNVTACDLAIIKAEEDIKKEHGTKVPYIVEVIYFDREHQDCAVTLSVDPDGPKEPSRAVASVEDEINDLLVKRTETVQQCAFTGLTKDEFEKYSQEKVVLHEDRGPCTNGFESSSYSIHGSLHVCWKGEHILGYCTLKDGQCWTRTAN